MVVTKIQPSHQKERPELCHDHYWLIFSDDPLLCDFRRVKNAEAVMYHLPTETAFEIVYDRDQDMIGGITVFGLVARIREDYSAGQPPEDAENSRRFASTLSLPSELRGDAFLK